MATIYWQGTASPVAQVQAVTITAYDAATTYRISIGGAVIGALADTDAPTTAEALADAFNASTRPEKSGITASHAGSVVTLTGTPGLPFTAAASVVGGTGTIATAVVTSATGPNFWDNAANWSGGSLPANGDDVVIDGGPSICWQLDQSALELASLRITQEFTNRIGLNRRTLALSANALNVADGVPEYRPVYLSIGASRVDIGEQTVAALQPGSPRIMLDLGDFVSTVVVHRSGSASADTGQPAIRLLIDEPATTLEVRSANAGVGIAVDRPGEESELYRIDVTDSTTASRVATGAGVTVSDFAQRGGNNLLQSEAQVSSVSVFGGELRTEGPFEIVSMRVEGGQVRLNNLGGADAVVTLRCNGGVVNALGSSAPRSIDKVVFNRGGTLVYDAYALTIDAIEGRLSCTGA